MGNSLRHNSSLHLFVEPNSPYYECFEYPGGELQVRLKWKPEMGHFSPNVKITSRIHNSRDIMETLLLVGAFHGLDIQPELYLPYLPYGRADRRFVPGDCFGLLTFLGVFDADVDIATYDAHNDTFLKQFGGITSTSPAREIGRAITAVAAAAHDSKNLILLYPDEGAQKRYNGLLDGLFTSNLGTSINLIESFGTKVRDQVTGKITHYALSKDIDYNAHPILVVDDICDGGATFELLAYALTRHSFHKPSLYVSHGIFSKGTTALLKLYRDIFCVDTFHPVEYYRAFEVECFEVFGS